VVVFHVDEGFGHGMWLKHKTHYNIVYVNYILCMK
jgi:hypothetical protein